MSLSTDRILEDKVDLSDLRNPFDTETEPDFSEKDPFKLFHAWLTVAQNTEGIKAPHAMALATADKSGKPSVRYLVLRAYGKSGFHFCSSFESRKAKEMAENPNVSLLFYWESLSRQIRIEGTVEKLDEKESEHYFHSRSRDSQISTVLSHQSEVIESKEVLMKKQRDLEKQYADESIIIPKPPYWGGYKVVPKSFEFWHGHKNRLHDRMRFRLPAPEEVPDGKFSFSGENGWIYEYLSP